MWQAILTKIEREKKKKKEQGNIFKPLTQKQQLKAVVNTQKNCNTIDKNSKDHKEKVDINEQNKQTLYENTLQKYNIETQTITNNINKYNDAINIFSDKEKSFILENNEALTRFNTHKKKFKDNPELSSYINKLKEIQNVICGQPQDIYHSIINDSNIKIHELPDTSCDHIIMDFNEPNTLEPPILQWFKVNKFDIYTKNDQKKYLFSNIDSIEIKQTYKTKILDIKIPDTMGNNIHDYNFTKKEKKRLFDITKINNIDTYDINENDNISTGSYTEVKINTRNQDNTLESFYIKKKSLIIGWNVLVLNPYTLSNVLKVEEYKNFYDEPEEMDTKIKWESASGKIVSDDNNLLNEKIFTNWGGRCYAGGRKWGVEPKGKFDCSPHEIVQEDGEKNIMGKKYLPIASWAPSSAKEDCAKSKECKVLSCEESEFNGGHYRWVDPNDHTKYLSERKGGKHVVISEDTITGMGVCNAYDFKPINWRESVNESKKDPSWTLDNGMTGKWSWNSPVTQESGKKCEGNCIDNRADWKLNKVYLKPQPNPITKASTKAFKDMNEWFNKNKKKYDKHIVIITVQNPLLQKASKADPKFNDSFDTLMKLCSCNLTSKDLKLNDTNNSENPQFLNIIGKINLTGTKNNVGTYGCIWKKNNFNSKDNTDSATNDSLTTIISKHKVEHIFNSPNSKKTKYILGENKDKNNINLINLIKEDIDVSKCVLPFSKFKINNKVIYDNKIDKEYPITKLVSLIFKPNIIEPASSSIIKHIPSTYEENNEIITILTEIYKIYKKDTNDTIPIINWKDMTQKLTDDDKSNQYKIGVYPLPTYKACSGYQDCKEPEWGKYPHSIRKLKSSKNNVSWMKQKRDLTLKQLPTFDPKPTRALEIIYNKTNFCIDSFTNPSSGEKSTFIESDQSDFKNNYNNKINIYTLLHFLLLLSIVYALFYILQRTNTKKNMLYIYFTMIIFIIIITFIIILTV